MTAITVAMTSCFPSGPAVSARLDGRANSRVNASCFSGFTVASTGLEYEYSNIGGQTNSTTWLDSGSSSEVWVMWTRTSGTLSDWNSLGSGNNNVRLQCSTNRNFRIIRTSSGTHTILGYCRFYDAATGGSLLQTTSTVTWSAQYIFDGCPLCCFTPDTLITMADGKYLPIKDIREGDKILVGAGPDFGEEEVEEIIVRHDRPMYRIHFDNGAVLEASEDHPFHVKGKGAASINPTVEYKDLGIPKKIEIGDIVSTEVAINDYQYTTIVKIEPMDYRGIVMTLGNSMFFANGICVY